MKLVVNSELDSTDLCFGLKYNFVEVLLGHFAMHMQRRIHLHNSDSIYIIKVF